MDADIQKMIKILDSEVGYDEKGNGFSKFGKWYSENVDDSYDFSNAAWCDMFLAWGADQAGITEQTGEFAYTPSHASWFKKKDAWDDEPAPGALVFYDWSGGDSIGGIDHVGIVTKVTGDRIHTIEGNVDGGSAKRKVRDQDQVVGYGRTDKLMKEAAEKEAAAKAAAPAAPAAPAAGGGNPVAMAYTPAAAPPDAPSVELWGAFSAVILMVAVLVTLIKRQHGRLWPPRTRTSAPGRHRAVPTTTEEAR